MENPYQPVLDRIELLEGDKSPLDKNSFNRQLKLKHKDNSEFYYSNCYYELFSYKVQVKSEREKFNLSEHEILNEPLEETITCIIIIPQFHFTAWYDVDDLLHIEAIDYDVVEVGKNLLNSEYRIINERVAFDRKKQS